MNKIAKLLLSLVLLISLTACSTNRLNAQERIFLDLKLEFLDEYQLPKSNFNGTKVGGLSAIAYDPASSNYYVISDDRSNFAPARFYTFNIGFNQKDLDKIGIEKVDIKNVTYLRNENGQTYPAGSVDLEGIAVSPKRTIFVSSEGIPSQQIAPLIAEYDIETGKLLSKLRLPQRYLPNETDKQDEPPRGVQDNLGFESLSLNPNGLAASDPFRLFTATEAALLQDKIALNPETSDRLRFLHYVIGPVGSPLLLAEHLYLLEPTPKNTIANGLTEMSAIEPEGFFLTLERTFGAIGAGAKIFQVVIGNATDISGVDSLKGELGELQPLKKKILLDLSELGIYLDNLEAMTLGPRFRDGTQSLILLSDDNFRDNQVTQFLLFRLTEG
ncbi:esterase-like activity of phytase family protein [Oscillatoria salina]|uniref:esterase-like activity of phytase family protein n=1 Tax=Oscillatoria salina TaxID=331517 RepID=UPI001CCB78CC|nr:esterase-like activity of phytase family protein [Oscillatoria salina]MBZ8182605.1 esterase-like activity of phytase family protein [Oscillatoria salina IIICB1]